MSPIFIVGCPRSGTTLLALMLNKSSSLNVTLESGFLPELERKSQDYGDFASAKERWYFIRDLQNFDATSSTKAFDIFKISEHEAEEAIRNVAPVDYAGAADAIFKADAVKMGAERWANKTPKYVLKIDKLAEMFPQGQFIHLVRDPRDVAASIVRAGWASTFREATQIWIEHLKAGREARRNLSDHRYFEVRYEDLVLNPIEEVKEVRKWAKLKLGKESLGFYEKSEKKVQNEHDDLFPLINKPIDRSRAYAWHRELSDTNISDVEKISKKEMKEIGYSLTKKRLPLSTWCIRKTYNAMYALGENAKSIFEGYL